MKSNLQPFSFDRGGLCKVMRSTNSTADFGSTGLRSLVAQATFEKKEKTNVREPKLSRLAGELVGSAMLKVCSALNALKLDRHAHLKASFRCFFLGDWLAL